MTWHITGTIRPREDGGMDVDLRASRDTASRKAAPTIAATPEEDYAQQIELAKSELGPVLADLAGQMVDVMAAANKTGKVSARRALAEVYVKLVRAAGTLPEDALVHGMTVAIGKDIPNVNYAKRAAEGFTQDLPPASTIASTTSNRYDILGGNHQ